MAKVAMRVYTREIEELIDSNQIKEAIAHARHILEYYPKYFEPYKMLGKAYLEEQQFGDAADIFQRVLSTKPDDFISHVGMSIIREDEGVKDAAIWHMERAFEFQPSNQAIQDELRRLYGLRDGIEPPKVRLTRGALARMYTNGELYDQAIAELRTAIAEDAQRPDLLVLLVEIYYKTGKMAEAADISKKILKKLPNSIEANHTLAKIYTESNQDAEALSYVQLVEALDPYLAMTSEEIPLVENVPDNAVTIERLDWRPGMEADSSSEPAWAASLGESLQSEDGLEKTPEWLNSALDGDGQSAPESDGKQDSQSAPFKAETESAQEELPDWLGEKSDEVTDQVSEPEPETSAPEEIPDWMQTAATEDIKQPAVSNEEEEAPAEIPDWMNSGESPGADDAEIQPIEAESSDDNTPEVIDTPIDAAEEAVESPQDESDAEEIPDWMTASVEDPSEAPAQSESESDGEEIPDWMAESSETVSPTSESVEETVDSDIPDWMTSAAGGEGEEESISPEDSPQEDLLARAIPSSENEELANAQAPISEPASSEMSINPASEEIPDEGSTIQLFDQPLGEDSASEDEDVPDWMVELGGPPATSAEEEVPDWMAEPSSETDAVAAENAEPMLTPSSDSEEANDLNLLITPVDEAEQQQSESPVAAAEQDSIPDFLASAGWGEGTGIDEDPGAFAADDSTALDTDQASSALTSDSEDDGEIATADIPDWMKDMQPDGIGSEAEADEGAVVENDPAFDTLFDSEPTKAVDPSSEKSAEGSDWMAGFSASTEKLPGPIDASQSEDSAIAASSEEPTAADENSDWLSGLADHPQADLPTQDESDNDAEDIAPEDETDAPPAPDSNWLAGLQESVDDNPPVPTAESISKSLNAAKQAEQIIEDSSDGGDDSMDWLEGLAENVEGAEEQSEPDIDSNLVDSALPDGLQADMAARTPPSDEITELTRMATQGNADSEEDKSMSWLEGLAARQGADEEELITSPEERTEDTPEWLQGLEDEPTQQEGTGAEASAGQESAGGLLQQIDAAPEESTSPAEPTAEGEFDWLKESTADEFLSEEAIAGKTPGEDPEWFAVESSPEEIQAEFQKSRGLPADIDEENSASKLAYVADETNEPFVETPQVEDELAPVVPEQVSFDEQVSVEETPVTEEEAPAIMADQSATMAEVSEVSNEEVPDVVVPIEAAPKPKKAAPRKRKKKSISDEEAQELLARARQLMESEDLPAGLDIYAQLINKGLYLDQIVEDMQRLLVNHPIDISIFQTLGDAYMKADHLQDALDSYSKAEDLLR